MSEKYQLPPGKDHLWKCTWNGGLYTKLPDGTAVVPVQPRNTETVVREPSAFYARRAGSLELGVPPEFVDTEIVKEKEDGKTEQDVPADRGGDRIRSRHRKASGKRKAPPRKRG